MACKRSEQCEHADICQYAKSNAYDILCGSCYRPKKPMTNEEWFCGLSTEKKAKVLACEFIVACDDYAYSNNKETWNEKYWVEWLKQPHSEKND